VPARPTTGARSACRVAGLRPPQDHVWPPPRRKPGERVAARALGQRGFLEVAPRLAAPLRVCWPADRPPRPTPPPHPAVTQPLFLLVCSRNHIPFNSYHGRCA